MKMAMAKLCGQTMMVCLLLLALFWMDTGMTLRTYPYATKNVKVGAIFEDQEAHLEKAFNDAISLANRSLLNVPSLKLLKVTERVSQYDSFHTSKKVCRMIRENVMAILGPQSEASAAHVQSVARTLEIPHLEIRWDMKFHRANFSLNFHPHPMTLSRALFDFINVEGWKSAAIVYEGNEGLIRMQELLKKNFKGDVKIIVKQLDSTSDYRTILKEIKAAGHTTIILDCSPNKAVDIMRQAQQIGMMNHYFSYFLTSLDMHTIDMEPFRYSNANITGFRLVLPDTVDDMVQRPGKTLLTTTEALIYDAVKMLTDVLREIHDLLMGPRPQLSCDNWTTSSRGSNFTGKVSIDGKGLVNALRLHVLEDGFTGKVSFDEFGRRNNFSLDIVKVHSSGLLQRGLWHTDTGIQFNEKSRRLLEDDVLAAMKNVTLKVTTIKSEPYVMEKDNVHQYRGNDRYKGYCVDMLTEICKELGCNFTINLVKDGKHGSLDKDTGKWSGMLKELLDQEADLAIGDLSITLERKKYVDFTMPFMNLGISILYKNPPGKTHDLFSFLRPLSSEVWLYMATAFLGFSILLFLLARFNPYDWESPHPCDPEPDELENKFRLMNSMWFAIGSLLQQGSDLGPKALSTRILAGIWWFFTLIMVSSYTANLAAFLTAERKALDINSVADLAAQTSVKYGCLSSGTTKAFFKESEIPLYQNMWNVMESADPSVFTNDNKEGVQRVLRGNYAFLIESTANEYFRAKNCELTQIGQPLDSKSYGIATPRDSPYRFALSRAVLTLQEHGDLDRLKDKWWRKQKDSVQCESDSEGGADTSELGLPNVGGVFVVLLGGMGMACVVGVIEFVWKTRKTVQEERGDLVSELKSELLFALDCRNDKKPVKKNDNKDGLSLPLTNDS